MASMALLDRSRQTDKLLAGYMVSTSPTLVGTSPHLTYTTPGLPHPSSPLPNHHQHPGQRIAPKLPGHHQHQQHQDLLRCKRRIQLGAHLAGPKGAPQQPAAVARRNERERNRVRLVNLGFATLRQHVPSSSGKSKKMSKVDTLRSAVDYIKRLQELLGEAGALSSTSAPGSPADENSYPPQSSTGSPTPSLCSEASSPYQVLPGDEDEELMDFASWF